MTCSMLGNVAVVAVGVIKTLLIVLGPIPEAEDFSFMGRSKV